MFSEADDDDDEFDDDELLREDLEEDAAEERRPLTARPPPGDVQRLDSAGLKSSLVSPSTPTATQQASTAHPWHPHPYPYHPPPGPDPLVPTPLLPRPGERHANFGSAQNMARLLKLNERPRAPTTPHRPSYRVDPDRLEHPKWAISAVAAAFAFAAGGLGVRGQVYEKDDSDDADEASGSLNSFFQKSREFSRHMTGRFASMMQLVTDEMLRRSHELAAHVEQSAGNPQPFAVPTQPDGRTIPPPWWPKQQDYPSLYPEAADTQPTSHQRVSPPRPGHADAPRGRLGAGLHHHQQYPQHDSVYQSPAQSPGMQPSGHVRGGGGAGGYRPPSPPSPAGGGKRTNLSPTPPGEGGSGGGGAFGAGDRGFGPARVAHPYGGPAGGRVSPALAGGGADGNLRQIVEQQAQELSELKGLLKATRGRQQPQSPPQQHQPPPARSRPRGQSPSAVGNDLSSQRARRRPSWGGNSQLISPVDVSSAPSGR
ncbi:hypothetical protein DIPPA_16171 [Diplonema papillatum]|nr:hypothetical protein DIPPA_16171 [Diplonema papillatum]